MKQNLKNLWTALVQAFVMGVIFSVLFILLHLILRGELPEWY